MMTRRKLLSFLFLCAGLVDPVGTLFSPASAAFWIGSTATATAPFPGQVGNLVGYTNTPAVAPPEFAALNGQSWPGAFSSLTNWPGGTGAQTVSGGTNATSGSGTSNDPWVFAFQKFDALTAGTLLSLSNAIFVGCGFESNSTANYNVKITGSNVNLIFCSITPRSALISAPPNSTWPSAGAGLQIYYESAAYTNSGGYCTPTTQGYQYGVDLSTVGGVCTLARNDFWGFGNSIILNSTTVQINILGNWIHDSANCVVIPPGNVTPYHVDGPGYLNGSAGVSGTPPTHVLIQGNTIATISNTNGIAMQGALNPYSFIYVIGNYLTGFALCADMCHNTSGNNNLQFTDNVFGTDLPWIVGDGAGNPQGGGALYANFSTQFSGNSNLWRRNTLRVRAGTSRVSPTTPNWTSGDNGKFLLPDSTLSSTDWTG